MPSPPRPPEPHVDLMALPTVQICTNVSSPKYETAGENRGGRGRRCSLQFSPRKKRLRSLPPHSDRRSCKRHSLGGGGGATFRRRPFQERKLETGRRRRRRKEENGKVSIEKLWRHSTVACFLIIYCCCCCFFHGLPIWHRERNRKSRHSLRRGPACLGKETTVNVNIAVRPSG